jgi:uncharacterized protein YigA (DUF484 family)
MVTKAKAKQAEGLSASEVAEFLAENPDFFSGRDDLLLKLNLPHAHSTNNGQAISLVERQVALLRERNRDTRKQLDELVIAAKRNNQIFNKCQKLTLSLINAKDSAQFFKALESGFKREFNIDALSLIIFSEYAHQVNHFTSSISQDTAAKYVGSLMKTKEPYLGVLRSGEQDFLFRHSSTNVRSAAVLPVKNRRLMALLAIGSSDANYFQSGMGTVFISGIADVLSRLLPRFVYLDPQADNK